MPSKIRSELATVVHSGKQHVKIIFVLHLLSTFCMLGITWFVQLVHYPLLGQVSRYRASAYQQTHMRKATWVFGPPMVVEFVTSIALIWYPSAHLPFEFAWTGFGLLIIIWLSTAFLQAPRHEVLAEKYSEETHRSLIAGNWLRTSAWTLRAAMLFYFLVSF